jgi:hypothetical protein
MTMAMQTYKNPHSFFVDFQRAWGAEINSQSISRKSFHAFAYYLAGLRLGGMDAKGLSIGLTEKLKKTSDWKNNGPKASILENPESGTLFITEKDGLWEVFYNDSFILGGIHSLSRKGFTVRFISEAESSFKPKSDTEIFDAIEQGYNQLDIADMTKEFPIRVTQREILGLLHFGYDNAVEVNGDRVFYLSDVSRAKGATLVEYKRYMDKEAQWIKSSAQSRFTRVR